MKNRGISSFSVLLLMVVATVVGIACFSMLRVQYTPSAAGKDLTVRFSYPGASARIVEAEVTSKLEGVLSTVRSCSEISSVSDAGGGSVVLQLDETADLQAVRFEVASQIRNIYQSLPSGCSYPNISLNSRGEKAQTAISYKIRSPLPSKDIARFVEDRLMHPLSALNGVSSVNFYGQTPDEWVVTLDSDKASVLGIDVSDIRDAFVSYYDVKDVGIAHNSNEVFSVKIRNAASSDMSLIPVKKVDGRIIHLGDIATFRYQESLPSSYYRVNGLNVLTLMVEASSDANIIDVVKSVKKTIAELTGSIPEEIGVSVGYDYSEYISGELDKIYVRTLLCLAILLLFVFVMNRSWRYMLVIAMTLIVNISVSVAVYYLTGIHIHIYTLAGITVSLGIIIDNSIVMIDHYSRTRKRSVFPALLAAVLTTAAALLVILLLPDTEKVNLTEFSLVIIINLAVSLLVSYLFVPALLDYLPVKRKLLVNVNHKRLVRTARWNRIYSTYISWGVRHKWIYVLLLVLAFGIPTCLIPQQKADSDYSKMNRLERFVDRIAGWKPYSRNRVIVDKIVGGSFALFYKAMSRADFYREPTRPTLTVRASMPEGCTVHQLNEVMLAMENYLAGIEEIDIFETRVSSYDNGTITVMFKPEYENTWLPSKIKSDIISMASDFGGANWSVSGVDESYFNNNIVSDYRTNSIILSGYNYDQLINYGEQLIKYLGRIRRVSSPEIWGIGYNDKPKTELNLRYDFETLAAFGISPYEYYSAIQTPLFSSPLITMNYDGEYVSVRMESSQKDKFDIWHVRNVGVEVEKNGDAARMKLKEVGNITKDRTDLAIRKENQSYQITVRFDFIGSYQLARKTIDEAVEYMNGHILPLGYIASSQSAGWFYDNQEKYMGLILLVVVLIFVICSIHFNSLRLPLSIVLMIPISFIGMFLIFGLSDFTFDKGGFAAFVMLSGITVNAGIYLISEWRDTQGTRDNISRYCRAFNLKIWPIGLTVISTILGLIPFLFDGPSEVFWFSFAIGTIAGLLFSVFALVFYLPIFATDAR